MYLVGFVTAWWLARRRATRPGSTWTPTEVDDLIFYCALGVILGGRLGWMLFYGTERILEDPLSVLRIWEGGMSFHGGLVGVLVALALFASRRGKALVDVFDFAAPLPAIGFGAGRIGNFINGELWGKPTDVPWAVVVDGVPLHAIAAVRGRARGPGAVRHPLVVHRDAAAALGAVGAVPALLRRVPLRRRVRARAGREPRLPVPRLGDDGPDAVVADDPRRPLDARHRLPAPRAFRQLRAESCASTST